MKQENLIKYNFNLKKVIINYFKNNDIMRQINDNDN